QRLDLRAGRDVAIEPRHPCRREALRHLLRHLLGAEAAAIDRPLDLAARARGRHARGVAAVVAHQTIALQVIRERDVAVRAAEALAAGAAEDERRVAAPVE